MTCQSPQLVARLEIDFCHSEERPRWVWEGRRVKDDGEGESCQPLAHAGLKACNSQLLQARGSDHLKVVALECLDSLTIRTKSSIHASPASKDSRICSHSGKRR